MIRQMSQNCYKLKNNSSFEEEMCILLKNTEFCYKLLKIVPKIFIVDSEENTRELIFHLGRDEQYIIIIREVIRLAYKVTMLCNCEEVFYFIKEWKFPEKDAEYKVNRFWIFQLVPRNVNVLSLKNVVKRNGFIKFYAKLNNFYIIKDDYFQSVYLVEFLILRELLNVLQEYKNDLKLVIKIRGNSIKINSYVIKNFPEIKDKDFIWNTLCKQSDFNFKVDTELVGKITELYPCCIVNTYTLSQLKTIIKNSFISSFNFISVQTDLKLNLSRIKKIMRLIRKLKLKAKFQVRGFVFENVIEIPQQLKMRLRKIGIMLKRIGFHSLIFVIFSKFHLLKKLPILNKIKLYFNKIEMIIES